MIVRLNTWQFHAALFIARLIPNIWVMQARVQYDTTTYFTVSWGQPRRPP